MSGAVVPGGDAGGGGAGVPPPARAPLTARQRARLREVFGDVLPSVTSDEVDPGSARSAQKPAEEWLRANKPPHHAD